MFDYSKLLGLMTEKNYTQKKLCKVIDMSENTFTNKIKGRSNFASDEIVKICNVLGISTKSVGAYFFTPVVWQSKHSNQ